MNKIKYWIPAVILMVVIFFGSHDPVSGEKSDFITRTFWAVVNFISGYRATAAQEAATSFVVRKIAHITEYMVLSFTYYYALSKTSGRFKNFRQVYLIAGILAFLYAISDEFHQTFIPGRVGTFEDVLIDSAGIGLGYLVLVVYFYLRPAGKIK